MALLDIFKKKNVPPVPLNITNIALGVGMTLVIVQAFGLIFGNIFGLTIKLGPIVIMIAVLIASMMGIVVLKRLINGQEIGRTDAISIVIVTIIALIVMFLLKDYVPEIFSVGTSQLQSMVGLG